MCSSVPRYNDESISVCLLGEKGDYTEPQYYAARMLVAMFLREFHDGKVHLLEDLVRYKGHVPSGIDRYRISMGVDALATQVKPITQFLQRSKREWKERNEDAYHATTP